MEREEAMTLAMDRIELFSKWYVQLTLSLIALLLAAILYSIIGSRDYGAGGIFRIPGS